MLDLTILVCLYNKSVDSSETIQSLLKGDCKREITNVIIWDNSIKKLPDVSLDFLSKKFLKFVYRHTPVNVVLSTIYNSVISSLKSEDSFLMLCDDDSKIPDKFFETLNQQINLYPNIDLFIPKIFSGIKLVSPAKDYLIITKLLNNIPSGIYSSKNLTAINSGMVLSNRLFINGFRYDSKLKFYGTDNYFMYNYRKKNKNLVILDVYFQHSLSFSSSDDVDNKLRIFKEIKRANKIIYSEDFYCRQLVVINNFIVSAKLCIKYRKLDFFYN